MSGALALDANASVPPLAAALDALVQASRLGANPSSPHRSGQRARQTLDRARRAIATALGGDAKEVLLTSGASEGNRWLVDALVRHAAKVGERLVVVTSPLEHPSVARPLAAAHDAGHLEVRLLPVHPIGHPRAGALAFDDEQTPRHLDGAAAVMICAAHSESGVLTDLDALGAMLGDDVMLLVDAAQTIGRLATPPPMRVDAVCSSAHKLGGVAGAGAVLLRARARVLDAGWEGGGQEGGRRPGTEALGAHAAFGAACAAIDEVREAHAELTAVRDRLEAELRACIDDLLIVGEQVPRLPNTTCAVPAGVDGDALRMACGAANLEVGFGSACSALAPEPSAALMAMGLGPAEARCAVRLSLAPGADERLAVQAARGLGSVVAELRSRAA
jgi:cysteine desulfurase